MNTAAYSVSCPACGSAFLSTHTRPTTITSCPHCAHNAPLQRFLDNGSTPLSSAPPVVAKRRLCGAAPPADAPAPPPVLPEMPVPASPLQALASPFSMDAVLERGRTRPYSAEAGRPIPSSVTFLPSPEAAPYTAPKRHRSPLASVFVLLGLAVVVAVVVWLPLIREDPQTAAPALDTPPAASPPLLRETAKTYSGADSTPLGKGAASPSATASPTVFPAVPRSPSPPTPPPLDLAESARIDTEAPEVMLRLFTGNPDERPGCIDDSKRHSAGIAAFFDRAGGVRLEGGITRLPMNPIDLASLQPTPLFQAATSANPGGALVRFRRGSDDQLRLDWPFFQESHDKALPLYLETTDPADATPRWFHVSMQRNHGLDFDAAFRETHLVFHLQTAPGGILGTPGIAARDLPVGRFLHQNTEWRIIYLARLLLLKKNLPDGTTVLEILDGEGVARKAQPVTKKQKNTNERQ